MTSILIRSDYGTDVSSRQRAAELRVAVEAQIGQGCCVELDFSGVRSISSSFADELFGLLVDSHGEAWFREHIRVLGLSPFLRRTILESVANRIGEKV